MAIGLGAALGLAGKLGGSIFSAIKGRKLFNAYNEAQQKILKDQVQKNLLWYNRKINSSGLERANAQATLNALDEQGQQRLKNLAGRSAVMGGSNALRAAEQNQQNQARGNVMQGLAIDQERRNDVTDREFRNRDAALANQQMELNKSNFEYQSGQVKNAGDTMANLSDGVSGALDDTDVRGIWNKKYRTGGLWQG